MTNDVSDATAVRKPDSSCAIPDGDAGDAAAQFVRLADSFKSGSYSKEQLSEARRLLSAAVITPANAPEVCRGLSQFRVPESGEMLARKWAEIPADTRYLVRRWRWDGKEKHQVVSNCLTAAAGILSIDKDAALDMLAHAITSADSGEAERAAVISLRMTWIAPKRRDGSLPVPLQQLVWSDLGHQWRDRFLQLVIDTAAGKHLFKKEAQPPSLRQTAVQWLQGLAAAGTPDSSAHVRTYLTRLDPNASSPPTPQGGSRGVDDRPEAPAAEVAAERIGAAEQSAPEHPSAPAKLSEQQRSNEPQQPRSMPSRRPPDSGEAAGSVQAEAKGVSVPIDSSVTKPLGRRKGLRPLLDAIQQVHAAVAALGDESGADPTRAADGDARRLREEVARLQQRASAAEQAASEARRESRRNEVLRLEAEERLARIQEESQSLRAEVGRLQGTLEAAQQQAGQERDQNRRHTDIERQEAVRSFQQQLGEALRHDVRNLRETEQHPPSEDQAKFLRSVLTGVVRRLRAAGVPVESTDGRGAGLPGPQ
jgi:hypothetical protein